MGEVLRIKTAVIRKPRKCFGCERMIFKGDTAHIQTNTDNGEIYDITLCGVCDGIVSNMRSDDEFSEGDLKEDAEKIRESEK